MSSYLCSIHGPDNLTAQLLSPMTPHPTALSPRELEVAGFIAQGLPNKCIGLRLGISPWTVATHVRRIFGKLGVSSRAEMVGVLVKLGVL
jgi:two-component system, NarL family, nitrate/nitrite response regulator NarL